MDFPRTLRAYTGSSGGTQYTGADDRLHLLLSPPPPYCGVRPAFSARGAQPAVTVLHCDRQGLARFSLLSSDALHVVTFYPGLSFLWLHCPRPI